MSCIWILYIAGFSHIPAVGPGTLRDPARMDRAAQNPAAADPDALYANRSDLASARQAAAIWGARLTQNPRDFTSAVKLARVSYWLGNHAPASERKALLERGIAVARTAVALGPDRPDGHFWIAANMGALAESFGLRQGLKYRAEIRDELMTVLRLDPGFQNGSADRALGRWYFKVPGLFGGSNAKSEEHLRRSLAYAPDNTASLYFLAETLIGLKRREDARETLRKLIASPGDPDWAPEDQEYKARGQRLLDSLR
jgi:tetratricopeptide (TPR) repeat protein